MIRIESIAHSSGLLGAVDDLLIVASGFEQRCVGVCSYLATLNGEYQAKEVLLLHFDDLGDRQVRQRVGRLSPELRRLARALAVTRRIAERTLDPYSALDAADFFDAVFATLPRGASVLVDISSLSRLHVLYLLRAAGRSDRVGTLRVAYTAARYGRYDTLSWGSKEPLVLHGFGRPREVERETAELCLFCGLEPDRSYGVWRRFGQAGTTKVFVSSEQDIDRCAERAERLTTFAQGAVVERVMAFSPSAVTSLLLTLSAKPEGSGDRYLYIAPFTTKWEVIGTWQFFRESPADVAAAIVYAAPGRLNAAGRTRDELGDVVVAQVI